MLSCRTTQRDVKVSRRKKQYQQLITSQMSTYAVIEMRRLKPSNVGVNVIQIQPSDCMVSLLKSPPIPECSVG